MALPPSDCDPPVPSGLNPPATLSRLTLLKTSQVRHNAEDAIVFHARRLNVFRVDYEASGLRTTTGYASHNDVLLAQVGMMRP